MRQIADRVVAMSVAVGMTTAFVRTPSGRQAYLVIVGLAAIWIAAALVRTDATFHLGPIILPLIPLLIASKASRTTAVGVAVAVSAGVIVILSLTGNLSGPSFDPFSSALAESVVALIGSGILAVGLARRTR